MKQMIAILGIGIFAASCNTSSNKAAFAAQQNTIDSMKMEMTKKQVIDSMNEVVYINTMNTAAIQPQLVTVAPKPRKKRVYSYASQSEPVVAKPVSTVNNDNVYTQPTTSTPPIVYQEPAQAPVQQKKGWSAKAKGAAIGGVAGAAAGAIINKNQRVLGGAIGSVLGAGAGLGIGAIIDKKNGR
ncbi:MAG: hypothetical protein EOP51_12155 [Sphingobacteriales bacterium]|nr:MAG: hypothetical protein EOP51_12155 [Sphingobacteriales bacterium]